MNLKVIYSLLFLCFSLFAKAQFNKQFIVSGGFQIATYNQTLKYSNSQGGSYTTHGNQTNIGLSAEVGYFILKNISASYQFTYQFLDDNLGNRLIRKSIVNGFCLNKLFVVNDIVYLNFAATPFYQKFTFKEDIFNEIETINHGVIFTSGFNFLIQKNGLFGVNLFRTIDKFPDSSMPNKSGLVISYKYIFNKKTTNDGK